MAIRSAVVVLVTSFLLGTMLTHWTADSLTLWKSPLTDDHLFIAASYYALLSTMPWQMISMLVFIVLTGTFALWASFFKGSAGNIMFDGASLFLYGAATVVYFSTIIPHLQQYSVLPQLIRTPGIPFPNHLKSLTLELASSHLICSVALTGVMILQAARLRTEKDEAENTRGVISDEPMTDADVPKMTYKRSPRPSQNQDQPPPSPRLASSGSLRKKTKKRTTSMTGTTL